MIDYAGVVAYTTCTTAHSLYNIEINRRTSPEKCDRGGLVPAFINSDITCVKQERENAERKT
jgi:hypothetical protein